MSFSISFVPSANEDLLTYPITQQRIIVDSIKRHLTHEANQETRRRKKLTDHPIAPWELRVGDFRVFYDVEDEMAVKITAIGHKVHSDLFIRGMKVEL
jgi:mRNA-degrading endonuclease RelE of RelBE toxin-antitoxin system